jgi:hypothetical protein
MEIRPLGVHLFHAGGRMDRQTNRLDEAVVSFQNFVNARNEIIPLTVISGVQRSTALFQKAVVYVPGKWFFRNTNRTDKHHS